MTGTRWAVAAAMVMLLVPGVASAKMNAGERYEAREAIEKVLYTTNLGFELGDPDMFADAFASDGTYILDSKWPVFGYQKLEYDGRDEIREIVTDRLEGAKNANPFDLKYNPETLRRFNRISNQYIEIVDETHAKAYANWMVVMHTNQNIHTSAIGRYEDDLIKQDGKWLIAKRVRRE